MARSRSTWKSKTTSGICITKLIVNDFVSALEQDDDALRETWKAIQTKLALSLRIVVQDLYKYKPGRSG